jgi:hypothetical protein
MVYTSADQEENITPSVCGSAEQIKMNYFAINIQE